MSKTNHNDSENTKILKIKTYFREKFNIVKEKKEINKEKLSNSIIKYKEKISKISENKNETIKSIQEKNENLRLKRKEMYENFKDYCKIKKTDTLSNVEKIQIIYKTNKDKMKRLREDYKNFKQEKKETNRTIKNFCFYFFVFSNLCNLRLVLLKKRYSLKILTCFSMSLGLSLAINYYSQMKASRYYEIKRKQIFERNL